MDRFIQLEKSEILSRHPFTHPDYTFKDAKILAYMLKKLRAITILPAQPPNDAFGLVRINLQEEDGSAHRLVIVDWHTLQTPIDMTVVGFFGQIRTGIDHAPIMDIENALIDQLANYAGLLSYYNLYLPQQGYGNLVLFSQPDIKETWRTNPTHIQAADELTPQHYYSLRLHNGTLPGGLLSQHELILLRTKYYDFTESETWRAVREFV